MAAGDVGGRGRRRYGSRGGRGKGSSAMVLGGLVICMEGAIRSSKCGRTSLRDACFLPRINHLFSSDTTSFTPPDVSYPPTTITSR